MKQTLFCIKWGDDDQFFVVAGSEKEAIEQMPDGKDMIRSVLKLDKVYEEIYDEGFDEGWDDGFDQGKGDEIEDFKNRAMEAIGRL